MRIVNNRITKLSYKDSLLLRTGKTAVYSRITISFQGRFRLNTLIGGAGCIQVSRLCCHPAAVLCAIAAQSAALTVEVPACILACII
jgi:hypothetical protein